MYPLRIHESGNEFSLNRIIEYNKEKNEKRK